jgi:threonine/homoserine/homoserine lactone efflux protein
LNVLYYLSFGLILGLSAGLSPGPLLTLVISETLRHGPASGVKVALAPIICDAPIVVVTLLIATRLSNIDTVLGIISLLGGCYVLYMAYESTGQKQQETLQPEQGAGSLTKGIVTNVLSPHPYLFWLSVGAPTVAKSMQVSAFAPVLFIGGFYLLLVGSKVVLAVLAGRSRSFLKGAPYRYTMNFLALTLAVFAVIFFMHGLTLLGIYNA